MQNPFDEARHSHRFCVRQFGPMVEYARMLNYASPPLPSSPHPSPRAFGTRDVATSGILTRLSHKLCPQSDAQRRVALRWALSHISSSICCDLWVLCRLSVCCGLVVPLVCFEVDVDFDLLLIRCTASCTTNPQQIEGSGVRT